MLLVANAVANTMPFPHTHKRVGVEALAVDLLKHLILFEAVAFETVVSETVVSDFLNSFF